MNNGYGMGVFSVGWALLFSISAVRRVKILISLINFRSVFSKKLCYFVSMGVLSCVIYVCYYW